MKCFSRMLLLCLVTACAMPGAAWPVEVAESDAIVWPPAPAAPRIRYSHSLSNPENEGYRMTLGSRLGKFFAGAQEITMARPYGLDVNEDSLVVGDPGLSAVHVFGLKRKSYKLVSAIGTRSLSSPVGVALGDGKLYIADSTLNSIFVLNKRLRLVNEASGFDRPTSLAYDPVGQLLYAAETHAHRVLVLDKNANLIRSFGERGKGNGQFNFPTHITITGNHLLVNDTLNFRIQVFDLDGTYVSQFGQHGDSEGYFAQPKGVGLDSFGHVYVAESVFNRIQVYAMDGEFLLGFGRPGENSGEFFMPAGIAVLGNRIYVADSGNARVQVFDYIGAD